MVGVLGREAKVLRDRVAEIFWHGEVPRKAVLVSHLLLGGGVWDVGVVQDINGVAEAALKLARLLIVRVEHCCLRLREERKFRAMFMYSECVCQ